MKNYNHALKRNEKLATKITGGIAKTINRKI